MKREKLHTGHFALPRAQIYDLLAALALKKIGLAEWVVATIEAGLSSPPSFALKPDIPSWEPFRLPISNTLIMASWEIAKSWTENSGEHITAQDFMIVLLVRQARADINEAKAKAHDDHAFLAWNFAAFRDPAEEHDVDAVKRFNKMLEGVDCNFFAPLPRVWVNSEAQMKQNAEREALQKRMAEKQQAEAAQAVAERDRLARLLAV
jgi:hypothetical protein